MKTQLIKLISALFIITWPLLLQSQAISTTAGTVQTCPGELVVPVTVANCNNVGAISLVLQFNTGTLTFVGHENVHPQLGTGFLIVNSPGDKVIVSWASTTAANIGSGTLLDLRFSGIPGSSNMTWDTQTPGNCEYSDPNGNIIPSTYTNGPVTVFQPPVINTQPVNRTVLPGQNTSFSISAIATGITYRWQISVNGGSSWSDLNNGGSYSGVTTATLNVSNIPYSMNGNMYRCRVEGTCTPAAFSDPALLTVVYPITTTFQTQNTCPGSYELPVRVDTLKAAAAFSLAFSFNPAVLIYQGYQNVHPALAPGNFVANAAGGMIYITWTATSAVTITSGALVELQFDAVTGTCPLTWDTQTPGNCEYSDINGDEITAVFVNNSMTVYQIPSITSHPASKIIPENTNTTFSVTATGTGLSYQWQISTDGGSSWTNLTNGGHYSGVTSATLNVTNALLSMSGYQYHCVVSGTCPPVVTSNAAVLTVLPHITTTAGNETDCPGPVVIPVNVTHFFSVGAFSLTLGYNTSVLTYTGFQGLNPALGGGNFVCNAGGGKVFMTWTSTTASSFGDGLLIELLFEGVAGTSTLTWDTQTPGNCEYSDINGNIISASYVNGQSLVYQTPEITSHPVDKTVVAGQPVSFSITATGSNLGYQWQRSTDGGANWGNLSNGSGYSGVTTATMTVNPVVAGMDGWMFRCRLTASCPPTPQYSNPATLTVLTPITTTVSTVSNSCTGNLILPIVVSNCNNVGAISLTLNFNPGQITFNGYQDPHAELATGLLVVNSIPGKVIMSWASTDPADIGSGTLIVFRFILPSGSSTLTWDTQTPGACEYSDLNGNLFPTVFNNGTVSVVTNPLIADAGPNVTITAGGCTQLNGSASGGVGGYTYDWTPTSYLSNPAIPDPVATPPATITYTLTVTSGGCTAADYVTITVEQAGIKTALKEYLQGPFSGTQMTTILNTSGFLPLAQPYNNPPWNYSGTESVPSIPNADVVDWALVELRDAATASQATQATMIARQACFVLKDGSFTGTDGSSLPQFNVSVSQNLFVVLHHRNHLPVMSANPLTGSGGIYSYDYTTGSSQAYGGALGHKQIVPGIWGMIGGDGNADREVNNADKIEVWSVQAGNSGYLAGDFNLDSQVNNGDKNDIWKPNSGSGAQVP
ncbi:MAG: hypothetical protein JW861_06130 [Bacteroidales bacterium]|nr:hypothetical protein [Bacteroidales bacterium]